MASTFCEQQLGADVFILLNPSSSSCLHPPGTFTILDSSSSWRHGEFPGDQPMERGRDGRGGEGRIEGQVTQVSPHPMPTHPLPLAMQVGRKLFVGRLYAQLGAWCLCWPR